MIAEKIIQWILCLLGLTFRLIIADNQRDLRYGHGNGQGDGYGYGGGKHNGRRGNAAALEVIRNMMAHADDITRSITHKGNGVETFTTSDDPEVAQWIKDHVIDMTSRMETGNRIRQRDPFFVEVFNHASGSELNCDLTETNGVSCTHKAVTSNQCDIDLVQAHAQLVSLFLENGYDELMANHDPPDSCTSG